MFDNLYFKKHFVIIVLVCFILICFQSCSSFGKKQKNESNKYENFLNTWKLRAQESKGHSPSKSKLDIKALSKKKVKKDNILKLLDKPLPKKKVSLKMANENAGLVLKALARAVGLNIIINSEIKGNINIDIKNVPWDEAFNGVMNTNGLAYNWEGSIIRIMTVNDMKRDINVRKLHEEQKAITKKIKKVEELVTKVIQIDYADAEKLAANLKESLTDDEDGKKRGYIDVNKHTNSLIIQGIPSDLNQIVDLINELDRPTPQILIEADIVQTSKDIARKLGIQWGGRISSNVGGKRASFNPLMFYPATPGLTSGALASGEISEGAIAGLNYGTLNGNFLDMQLSAMETQGKLNIISRPSITTLDNQTASTESGTKVPFSAIDEDGNEFISFEDALLRLEITPHVINGNYLKMKVLIEKNEVDFSPSAKVGGNPTIKKRKTETTLIVEDSETIVISGLTKKTSLNTETGTPGFNKIPVIRWLFKNDNKDDSDEIVLVFLTPHILKKKIGGNGNRRADDSLIVEDRDLPLFEDNELFDAPDK